MNLGLKGKIIASTLLLISIALTLTMFFSYSNFKNYSEQQISNELESISNVKAAEIDALFDNLKRIVASKTAFFEHEDGREFNHEDLSEAQLFDILKSIHSSGNFDTSFIGFEDTGNSFNIQKNGQTSMRTVAKDNYDPRVRPWYKLAKEKDRTVVIPPYGSQDDERVWLGVAVPLTINNKFAGVIMGDFTNTALTDFISYLPIKNATITLLDNDLNTILSSRNNINYGDSLRDIINNPKLESNVAQSKQGFTRSEVNNSGILSYHNKVSLTEGQTWTLLISVDEETIFAQANESIKQQLLSSIILIAISGALIYFVLNHLYQPILALRQTIHELASGNGDLTKRLDVKGNDELADISSDINKFVTQLQNMMTSLRNVGDEVSSASTELAAVMTQSDANAIEQKAQVDLMAAAITELSSSAVQVDASATQADNMAKDVLELSISGSQKADDAARLSSRLSNQMNETSNEVMVLNEQTEKINEVITVINTISEQTNLLALNAAIEAARAGELGRGFAVVADEVRVLAGKTQNSTQDIQQIIEELQVKSQLVVRSVEQSISTIKETTEMSEGTSEQLKLISRSIENISETNAEMAEAANEQSRAISSISENVNIITESINQNVEGIKESAQASNHLSELSEGQKEQLAFFKL
ncbi:methyl-accepting chemotaxis protein [Vibrio sp. Of7-15]|uniref:methyl-accepting chemotaxis protein n=1 Tax=Vibrio sp. Of7-15 TaxID=2724879 RepID=UPI001EF2A927|nr:methyl-accepting chemotaxis protein [Vibrio sp. Of7-15]MCG7496607.1 methyl-accepting chemotaxis protein [Vibrio sp. Of7-15]